MVIIVSLIIALIVVVVIVNAIQQHGAKQEQERRVRAAKQKAIIDESEELLANLVHFTASSNISVILNRRCFNASKKMSDIIPQSKKIKDTTKELEIRLNTAKEMASNPEQNDEKFSLPDNEQQVILILQTIKKLRAILQSEQAKGILDAQLFKQEDRKLDTMQLHINVETLYKRGMKAFNKEMLGSARQYFEKSLHTLSDSNYQSEYVIKRRGEIEAQLEEIASVLKNANAKDAEKKAKAEEDDLDLLFQPKKKW